MEDSVSGEADEQKESKSTVEALDEAFPQYLAMGMSPKQYWEQDCTLVIAYRKAYKIRQEHENQVAWLQGLYIYRALNSALLHVNGFVPKGAVIDPYWDKPYDFDQEKKKATMKTKEETNARKMEDVSAYMHNLANMFNRSFAKRNPKPEQGGTDNAGSGSA